MFLIRRCGRQLWTRGGRRQIGKLRQAEPTTCLIRSISDGSYVFPIAKIPQLRRSSFSTTSGTEPVPNATGRALMSLCDSVRSNRVRYQDVEKVMESSAKDGVVLDEQNGLILLRCCGDMLPDVDLEKRRDLAQRVWELIGSSGHSLSVEHYNALLSIFVQNATSVDPDEFLTEMKATPNEETYQLLLDAAAKAGDYDLAGKVMSRMKDSGFPANERTFNALILAHSVNADIQGANAVVDTMQTAMIKPTAGTYYALSLGFARIGDMDKLRETLNVGQLSKKQLMDVVRTLSVSGNGKHIPVVLKYLPDATDINDSSIVNTIVEITHSGHAEDAFMIVDHLPVVNPSLDMSVRFADFFLTETVRARASVETILRICDALMESKKNTLALTKVAEVALRSREEEMALAIFEAMVNRLVQVRPHFYWPLLRNAADNGGEAEILKLLKHMVQLNVELDHDTLYNYAIRFLNLNDSVAALRKLQDIGATISDVFTPLLCTLLARGDLVSAIGLCQKIKGKIDNDRILSPLIQGYSVKKDANNAVQFLNIVSGDTEMASEFLMDMLTKNKPKLDDRKLASLLLAYGKFNLKISSSCADMLKQRFSASSKPDEKILAKIENLVNDEVSSSSVEVFEQIPHPRAMNVQELEDHLVQLKSKGMGTRQQLRRLLQTQCRMNNLQRVEELRKEIEDNGFEFSAGMRANLFQIYAKNNMVSKALAEFEEIRTNHKGFKLDEYKVVDLSTALVQDDQPERVMKILEEQTNVRGGSAVSRNCWRLLNAVASSKYPENTGKVLDLLVEKGYCERSNVLLGPLIRAHLLRDDMESAVEEFKRCATLYKQTPLNHELICALIRRSDEPDSKGTQEQLQDVLEIVKSVHGKVWADSQLLMALAATGKRKPLYNFLQTDGIDDKILKYCSTRLAEENQLTALETILEASRGVPKLNTSPIYNLMMTIYNRSGDCEGALKLWDKIQEHKDTPSEELRKSLSDLLTANKVLLPIELQPNIVKRENTK